MTWIEIISLVLNLLMAGGLVTLATLKSTRKTATAQAQGAGTDANVKLMETYEVHVLKPVLDECNELRKEVRSFKNEVRKLRKALDKADSCNYGGVCPVIAELQKQSCTGDGDDGDNPGSNGDTA